MCQSKMADFVNMHLYHIVSENLNNENVGLMEKTIISDTHALTI